MIVGSRDENVNKSDGDDDDDDEITNNQSYLGDLLLASR